MQDVAIWLERLQRTTQKKGRKIYELVSSSISLAEKAYFGKRAIFKLGQLSRDFFFSFLFFKSSDIFFMPSVFFLLLLLLFCNYERTQCDVMFKATIRIFPHSFLFWFVLFCLCAYFVYFFFFFVNRCRYFRAIMCVCVQTECYTLLCES